MKCKLIEHQREIFLAKKLPKDVSPAWTYPTKAELSTRCAFGKPNLARSYFVHLSLCHITVLLWKQNYCLDVTETLLEAHGQEGSALYASINNLPDVDFLPLQLLPFDWDIKDPDDKEEKRIMANKHLMLDACLLHYDLNLKAVKAFCGGR